MLFNSKKYIKLIFITVLFIITVFFIKIILNKLENNLVKIEEPITINLLTSVHPNLPWGFKAVESKILVSEKKGNGENVFGPNETFQVLINIFKTFN